MGNLTCRWFHGLRDWDFEAKKEDILKVDGRRRLVRMHLPTICKTCGRTWVEVEEKWRFIDIDDPDWEDPKGNDDTEVSDVRTLGESARVLVDRLDRYGGSQK